MLASNPFLKRLSLLLFYIEKLKILINNKKHKTMNTQIKTIIKGFFLFSFILLLSQCRKDRLTVDSQSPSEQTSINAIFINNGVQSQYFTINPNSSSSITGEKGIYIYFPMNAFVDANNQVVTDPVQIELKEILSLKDMILSNKQTVSNGEILSSGGEFYINATANGQELFINQRIYIEVPANNLSYTMGVFVGETDQDGNINWQTSIGDSTSISPIQDTLENKYAIWLDSVDYNYNWINCDEFLNDPNPLTNVKADISPDSVYSDTNTVVFMVIPATNSVYNMATPDPFTAFNIPEGKVVTFIGFSYYNNKLYFGYQENVTVVTNHLEALPLTEMSEADMLLLLDQIL
jgi:hypothetical protein